MICVFPWNPYVGYIVGVYMLERLLVAFFCVTSYYVPVVCYLW